MINSSIFSKSTIKTEPDLINDDFKPDPLPEASKRVNKNMLYHLFQSYIKMINESQQINNMQKMKACHDYGYQIGYHFAEEQCQGFIKSFIPKVTEKAAKPFLSQMKLLYTRVWTTIFQSTAKLFVIGGVQQIEYKVQDRQFSFTKSISSENEGQVKRLKAVIYEFVKGVIQGFLQKFDLMASVSCHQIAPNNIYIEIKKITKKQI